MNVFAVSDIHGDKRLIKELVEKAKQSDLIILAGDLTWAEADLTGIVGPFKETGKKVLMIPGNHETLASIDFLEKQYKPGVYNVHAKSFKSDGVGFFACGSGNIGLFQLSEEEVYEVLMNAHKEIENCKKKIMISHVPPYNTLLDDLGWTHAGSQSVRKVIEKIQPDICICGHLHETEGLIDKIGKTKIINVGHKGALIKI